MKFRRGKQLNRNIKLETLKQKLTISKYESILHKKNKKNNKIKNKFEESKLIEKKEIKIKLKRI